MAALSSSSRRLQTDHATRVCDLDDWCEPPQPLTSPSLVSACVFLHFTDSTPLPIHMPTGGRFLSSPLGALGSLTRQCRIDGQQPRPSRSRGPCNSLRCRRLRTISQPSITTTTIIPCGSTLLNLQHRRHSVSKQEHWHCIHFTSFLRAKTAEFALQRAWRNAADCALSHLPKFCIDQGWFIS